LGAKGQREGVLSSHPVRPGPAALQWLGGRWRGCRGSAAWRHPSLSGFLRHQAPRRDVDAGIRAAMFPAPSSFVPPFVAMPPGPMAPPANRGRPKRGTRRRSARLHNLEGRRSRSSCGFRGLRPAGAGACGCRSQTADRTPPDWRRPSGSRVAPFFLLLSRSGRETHGSPLFGGDREGFNGCVCGAGPSICRQAGRPPGPCRRARARHTGRPPQRGSPTRGPGHQWPPTRNGRRRGST
jgi:hypothetical protein